MPMPTMTRKLQKTAVEFGRWSLGHSFSPFTSPFKSWVRISAPSRGMATP